MRYFSSDETQLEGTASLTEKLHKIYKDGNKDSTQCKKRAEIRRITELDFLFYRAIIEAGDNIVFLLLFNSARELYHQKLEQFFIDNPDSIQTAAALKLQLIAYIAGNQQKEALALLEKVTSVTAYGPAWEDKL